MCLYFLAFILLSITDISPHLSLKNILKSLYCHRQIWQLVPCSLVSRLRHLSSTHDFNNHDQTIQFLFHLSIILFPKTNFPFPYALLRISALHLYVISIWEGFSFLGISLLIVHLITLHPDERKSSCSSSRVTIGFWLIGRPNFLDNLREVFFEAPVLFFLLLLFTTVLHLLNLEMNALIVVKWIFRLLEIFQ